MWGKIFLIVAAFAAASSAGSKYVANRDCKVLASNILYRLTDDGGSFFSGTVRQFV